MRIRQRTPLLLSCYYLSHILIHGFTINQKSIFSNDFTRLKATWSNGQAIQEYQDFLSGKSTSANTEVKDVPALIITNHPDSAPVYAIRSLSTLNEEKPDIVISANDPIPDTLYDQASFPIYMLLHPAELRNSLQQKLSSGEWFAKLDDFVFITWENINLEPYILRPFGLPRESTTQLLPFISFAQPPYKPQDLSVALDDRDEFGEVKYAMESLVCGKWKNAIAARFQENNLHISTCFYRDFRRSLWEKMVCYACFHLIGAVREERTTFADVANYYAQEVSDMSWQISSMLRGSMAISLSYGFEERMFEFALKGGKEIVCGLNQNTFPFCNGAFWDISKQGLERGFGDSAPLHTQYLVYAVREKGLLELDLPKAQREQKVSIMRQGNLRADGVV